MINFSKPFSTFEDGILNGATCYIMQEQEDYEEAQEILSGLPDKCLDKYEIQAHLANKGIWFSSLSLEHQRQLIDDFTR